ncbi:hypothetical protein A3758_13890 [Oleiphilus sp. HI0118]|nr:hypothetical protein A3758_21465 [Oleiphilus sp. HI0118]KZZ48365.1 hypothetical protein A3758_13890 [Oleiphilus sp. HI0118]
MVINKEVKSMRVAIIGRSELMYETMLLLERFGFELACVITAKEAPEYRIKVSEFVAFADRHNIPSLVTSKLGSEESSEFMNKVGALDLGLSVNFSGIIPQDVIDRFAIGILNAHGGDLPRYRGNACQAWALINGEDQIGLCIHKMIGGELDSGDIIEREYYPANINTKIGEVWSWMHERIPHLFLSAAQKLAENPSYILEAQSKDPKNALRCYPRKPEDGKIDWSKSAEEILRLINASGPPYAGAFTYLEGEKVVILDAELVEDGEVFCAVPGQVTQIGTKEGSITVACGQGKLALSDVRRDTESQLLHVNSLRQRFSND